MALKNTTGLRFFLAPNAEGPWLFGLDQELRVSDDVDEQQAQFQSGDCPWDQTQPCL
jgi:hypothetical protein